MPAALSGHSRKLAHKASEHALWDITGGRLLEWLRHRWGTVVTGLVFSGLSTAWGYVDRLPRSLLFVIAVGAFVLVLAAFALLLFIREKLRAPTMQQGSHLAEQRDSKSAAPAKIDEIRFDYLPQSPLQHGWSVAYGDATTAKWSSASDAPSLGAMSMQADPGCAIQLVVGPNIRLSGWLLYAAKYTDTTMIFARVAMASLDGTHATEKWIKFELGNGPPHQTTGYEEHEWTLPMSGESLSHGWRRFNVSLPDAVRRTWGGQGWTYRGLRIIRLRGTLAISPVECHQEVPPSG